MSLMDLNEGFERYLNQKFTAEEQKEFFRWLGREDNEEKVKQYLHQQLSSFPSNMEVDDVDFEKIYSTIVSNIAVEASTSKNSEGKSRNFVFTLGKVAAVALIIVASVFFIHRILQPKVGNFTEVAFCEIKAPFGTTTEITLPDGSHVWLNAGSKLRYNPGFGYQNRNLSLDGEAFFKVAKNKALPFIVKTSDISIKAVGTEFNVKAYQNEGTIEALLVEGKISITRNGLKKESFGEITLVPNQKATFVKEKTSFDIADIKSFKEELPSKIKVETGKVYILPKIDPSPAIAWKENRMIIRGEAMESLIIKLERKYDVKIKIESEYLQNFRFSGTLENETLQQVLDVIKLSAPIDYEIEGKVVTIKENSLLKNKFKRYLKQNE